MKLRLLSREALCQRLDQGETLVVVQSPEGDDLQRTTELWMDIGVGWKIATMFDDVHRRTVGLMLQMKLARVFAGRDHRVDVLHEVSDSLSPDGEEAMLEAGPTAEPGRAELTVFSVLVAVPPTVPATVVDESDGWADEIMIVNAQHHRQTPLFAHKDRIVGMAMEVSHVEQFRLHSIQDLFEGSPILGLTGIDQLRGELRLEDVL